MKKQKSTAVWKNLLYLAICVPALLILPASVYADEVTLMLDPGHGGDSSGAENPWGGDSEKTLNLKIGQYLKEALETNYDGVTVLMTREDDSDLELRERVNLAASKGADALISLHNNAVGDICKYTNGTTVLVSYSDYAGEITTVTQELGVNILTELEALGLENQGLLLRTSASEYYSNGEKKDYYGIVRRGVVSEIPSIIIEHGFMDDEEDYQNYLSDDEKLKALAEADARGIARYYQLPQKETGEPLEELANIETTMVLVSTDHWRDNEIWTETFFEKEMEETDLENEEETLNPESVTSEESANESSAEEADPSILSQRSETEESTELLSDSESGDQRVESQDAERQGFQRGLLGGFLLGICFGSLMTWIILSLVNRTRRKNRKNKNRKRKSGENQWLK